MFFKLFYQVNRPKINKLMKASFLAGMGRGYQIGYTAAQADAKNKGAILGGARVAEEVEKILEREGF